MEMLSPVHDLITKRMDELKATRGLTMAEVSRQLGRNATYLQQFIRRGVPVELDERDRFRLAALLDLNPEELRGPGRPRRARLIEAHFPQPSPAVKLVARTAQPSSMAPPSDGLSDPPGPQKPANLELAVFQAVREGGRIVIARRPFARFSSPPTLGLGNRAYCVTVADDTMSPEHRCGSMAIVDPDLEVQPGTTCVFREANQGGEMLIRHVRTVNGSDYIVEAYRPETGKKTEQHLSRERFPHVHVTVGNIFRI